MRISDWSSDVCSSDLQNDGEQDLLGGEQIHDPAQLRQGVVGGDVRLYVVVEVEVPTIEVGCRIVVVAEDLRDVQMDRPIGRWKVGERPDRREEHKDAGGEESPLEGPEGRRGGKEGVS